MTFFQAILLGGVYFLSAYGVGYGTALLFSQPISVVLWVGLILGDVPTAMKVGGMIQPMYLAFVNASGAIPTDKCAAGLVPAAVIITSGMTFDQSIGLAVTVALLMAQLHTIRRIASGMWVHMADRYAQEGNVRGIMLCGLVYCNLLKIVIFWIPMTFMLYFGAGFIGRVMSSLPQSVQNGLAVTGNLMPAMGYAATVVVIGRQELLPYFLAGFFLAEYTGAESMPIAAAALFVAFLDLRFFHPVPKKQVHERAETRVLAEQETEKGSRHLLRKRDLTRSWSLWWWNALQSDCFERILGLTCAVSLGPILWRLYRGHPEELKEALKRHLMFYNTSGVWGAMILGIVISMEEQRALGAPIPADAIVGVKTGLMGPISGIGDTIDWATIMPLSLAFFVPYAMEGHWWAALGPGLITGAIYYAEGYYFIHLGYKVGSKAALSILESGQMQTLMTFFSVLGMFAMGGLAAGMVTIKTPLAIPTSGQPMAVQQMLDAIVPGILSLLAVMTLYTYFRRGGTMMKATFWVLGIGLALGTMGILGT